MVDQRVADEKCEGRPVVVVVDDDLDLRELVAVFLAESGYEVYSFCDGVEALAFTREWPRDISMVLSDVDMPRMDGVALGRQLSRERPETKFLLMTGKAYCVDMIGTPFILRKPFRTASLLKIVQDLLAGRGPDA